ncbi:MAG: 4-(cytidine 5'-diphospho)-2-C-methyl-D-erythritol kinase [Thiomonas sp.]|nr:4-(cytidine 5'-diphospho)-2-C-methyl-D-erythritol kinase [Thiomonas sp.]
MRALFNLPAPAKINWFLHVTGRRPDGYHTLQTVFQFIDWCDTLDLIRRDDGVIRRIGAEDLPEHDLCIRAARLLQQTTQCPFGADIHLRKSIPQQAGLGGGSSDAATVLIGLNRLWQLGLSRQTLMQLALHLGADVPIFIFGRNACAQGVGEELQEIDLPTPWFAVVHPARGLSTRAVFCALDLTSQIPEAKIAGFAEWLKLNCAESLQGSWQGEQQHKQQYKQKYKQQCKQRKSEQKSGSMLGKNPMWGRNDLQQSAMALEPEVERAMSVLREVLTQNALQPCFDGRMTGSGSAVFAWICDVGKLNARAYGEALIALPAGWQGRLCQGLARHPLRHWIDA